MNKEQVINYIAFILVEKVQFPEKYNKPLFIRVQRKKTAGGQTKLAFSSETSYKNLDNNLIAHFDNEFSLPFTTVKKGDKYVKKVVEIQLLSVNNQKKEEVEVCKWRFDASNMPDPRDPSVHFSSASSDFGNINLYVRFCVIPAEEFSIGIPTNYFSFITKRTQAPDIGNTIDAFGISDNDVDVTDSNLSSLERKNKKEPHVFSLTADQPQEPPKKHHKSKGKHESDSTKKHKKHRSRGSDNPSSSQTDEDIRVHKQPEQLEMEVPSAKTEEKEVQKQDKLQNGQNTEITTVSEFVKEEITDVTQVIDTNQQENAEITNSNQNNLKEDQMSEIPSEIEHIKEDIAETPQEIVQDSTTSKNVESVEETDKKQQENIEISNKSQNDNEQEQKTENFHDTETIQEEITETNQEIKVEDTHESVQEEVNEDVKQKDEKHQILDDANSTQNDLDKEQKIETINDAEEPKEDVTEPIQETNQQQGQSIEINPEHSNEEITESVHQENIESVHQENTESINQENTEIVLDKNQQENEVKEKYIPEITKEESKDQVTKVIIETPQQNITEYDSQEKTLKKEKSKEELIEIMRQEVEMATVLAMKQEEERLARLKAEEIARQEEENRLFEEKRRENEQKLQEKIKKLKQQKQLEEQKSDNKEEVKSDKVNKNPPIEEKHDNDKPNEERTVSKENKNEIIIPKENHKQEEEDEYEYEYVEEEILEKVKVDFKVQQLAGSKFDTPKYLKKIKDLAVDSLSVRLALKCYSCIYFTTLKRPDYPILLARMLEKSRIFQHKDLTEEDVVTIFTPFFKSAVLATSFYKMEESIEYLSALINLGYTISGLAGELTNVNISTLINLEKVISKVINIITQTLAATIGQSIDNDGFNFVSQISLDKLTNLSSKFLKQAKDVEISDILLQEIIVKCCSYLDSLVFNVIMESGGEINNEKVTVLLENVRKIQNCFDCFSENFSTAFPNLLNFISLSQVFIGGFNEHRLRGKGPIARYIAENIRPSIQLPKKLKFEDIGPRVDKSSLKASIKIDPIEFSFEWLFVNSSTMNYDDE